MFHTLFDYQDQNVPNNNQIPKNKYKRLEKKTIKRNKSEYCYGQGNQAFEYYNKNKERNGIMNNDENFNVSQKFDQTKNKIKLIVYKNGFILNNGPFRDRAFSENEDFMEQVERGVIPHELMDKGINSLGILLINRKNEIFRQIPDKNHYSLCNNNIFNQYNQFENKNMQSNLNKNICQMPKKYNGNNIIPLGMNRINSCKNLTRSSDSKISFKITKDKIIRNNSGEQKEKQKKFTAFSGEGKLIRNVNISGFHVNKSLRNIIDIFQPVCTISIRLFNGEVIKAQFNYTQTLRDLYLYVRRISGCIKFHLLDGFPPKPLREYDRTIYELKLQNSLLTQKIY